MEAAIFVYFASIIENVSRFLVATTGVAFVSVGIICLIKAILMADDSYYPQKERKNYKFFDKTFFIPVTVLFAASLLNAFLPTERQMYFIGGAYLGQKTLTAVADSELMTDSMQIIKLKVKAYKKELENKDSQVEKK